MNLIGDGLGILSAFKNAATLPIHTSDYRIHSSKKTQRKTGMFIPNYEQWEHFT